MEIGPTESVTNVIKMSLVPSTFRGDQTNLAVYPSVSMSNIGGGWSNEHNFVITVDVTILRIRDNRYVYLVYQTDVHTR